MADIKSYLKEKEKRNEIKRYYLPSRKNRCDYTNGNFRTSKSSGIYNIKNNITQSAQPAGCSDP